MSETPQGDSPVQPSIDPFPDPRTVPAAAAEAAAASEPTSPTAVDLHVKLGPLQDSGIFRPRAAQVWAWALCGGGLAGLASWLIGEYVLEWFSPELKAPVGGPGAAASAVSPEVLSAAMIRNAALALALLGALMGGLLGMSGAMIRARRGVGLAVAALGAVLGIVSAVGAAFVVLPLYEPSMNDPSAGLRGMLNAVGALGGLWGAVGAAAGAAFGLGMGGARRMLAGMAGGAIGGFVGAAAYLMLASLAFPLDGVTRPIPTSREARLMARALASLFISAGVAAFVAQTRFHKGSDEPPAD